MLSMTTASANGAPTPARFDMEVENEDVVVDGGSGLLDLHVEALLACAPGFGAPKDLRGDVLVAHEDGEHEAASDVLLAWAPTGPGSTDFMIDATIEVSIPDEAIPEEGEAERTFMVRFHPEAGPDAGTECRPDGYTIPAREESFTVTVSESDPSSVGTALPRVNVAPMVLAVFLVAVLALFAYRRRG